MIYVAARLIGCECGTAVDYPGHPDERTETQCGGCGKVWRVESRP